MVIRLPGLGHDHQEASYPLESYPQVRPGGCQPGVSGLVPVLLAGNHRGLEFVGQELRTRDGRLQGLLLITDSTRMGFIQEPLSALGSVKAAALMGGHCPSLVPQLLSASCL